MTDYVKEELRRMEKRREYCKTAFPDYKDDEFNCVEMKFIYGIKSEEDRSTDSPSFCTLNDFVVYYNREDKNYYADIDVPVDYSTDDYRKYLTRMRDGLLEYIKSTSALIPIEDLVVDAALIQMRSIDLDRLLTYSYLILCGMCEAYYDR